MPTRVPAACAMAAATSSITQASPYIVRTSLTVPQGVTVLADWAARNGGVPINHMMVLRSEIVRDRPDVAREVYRMLNEAKTMAFPQPPMPDPIRIGIEDNRVSLDKMIGFCVQQRLIPHAVTVDELFDAFRATL